MALYDIDFSCGHTARIEILGKSIDRQKQLYYFKNYGFCPDCSKSQIDKLTDTIEQKFNLPEVVGVSEKQIRYARNLRAIAVNRHPEWIKTFCKKLPQCGRTIYEISKAAEKTPHRPGAVAYFCCIETNAQKIIAALKSLK